MSAQQIDESDNDPAVCAFLDFLAEQMERHPERLVPVTAEFVDRMKKLVDCIEVDLNEPIEGPVQL